MKIEITHETTSTVKFFFYNLEDRDRLYRGWRRIRYRMEQDKMQIGKK